MKRCLVVGIILLLIGASITLLGLPTQSKPVEYKELTVAYVFIAGRIKNPYYDGTFNFQVVNVTVKGIFWKDLGNPYFGAYQLNESWMVRDAQYMGINHFRIILKQSGITHVFGILANGDLLCMY